MKNKTVLLFIIGFLCIFILSYKNATKPIDKWPKKVYSLKDSSNVEAITLLGKILFYDPVLSADSTISCSSCHSPFNAFAHTDHALSHGINNKIGFRNAPALFNLAYQPYFMWDGAINHLDMQSLAPISHPAEMGSSIDSVVFRLKKTTLYPHLFNQAFGDSEITGERCLKAIAQFVLTLVSANSRYDKVKRGETAFTEQEEKGYYLFQQHCNSCHTEPLFTNDRFENNGLPVDSRLRDPGRAKITQNPADSFKFKVPTLRNIEFSYPYMHDGRFKRLSDVLKHYGSGKLSSPTLSVHLINGISLSSEQRVDLIAFLLTLTDRDFLFETKYAYPNEIFSR